MDEGQQIALSILREESDAWPRFYQAYIARLLARAHGLRQSLPLLRNQYQVEDLTQDFFEKKVVPRRKWERMFGPASRGEQPLWPLLCRSLMNHCLALHRRLAPKPRQVSLSDPGRDLPGKQRTEASLTGYTARAAMLVEAIRAALPAPQPDEVAFGHLLLLQVRLEVLQTAAAFLRGDDGKLPEDVPPAAAAEKISPWTSAEEQQQLLPDSPLTLRQAWDAASALALPPYCELTNAQTAGILGIPINTLNVYRRRARVKMLAYHGQDVFDRFRDS